MRARKRYKAASRAYVVTAMDAFLRLGDIRWQGDVLRPIGSFLSGVGLHIQNNNAVPLNPQRQPPAAALLRGNVVDALDAQLDNGLIDGDVPIETLARTLRERNRLATLHRMLPRKSILCVRTDRTRHAFLTAQSRPNSTDVVRTLDTVLANYLSKRQYVPELTKPLDDKPVTAKTHAQLDRLLKILNREKNNDWDFSDQRSHNELKKWIERDLYDLGDWLRPATTRSVTSSRRVPVGPLSRIPLPSQVRNREVLKIEEGQKHTQKMLRAERARARAQANEVSKLTAKNPNGWVGARDSLIDIYNSDVTEARKAYRKDSRELYPKKPSQILAQPYGTPYDKFSDEEIKALRMGPP